MKPLHIDCKVLERRDLVNIAVSHNSQYSALYRVGVHVFFVVVEWTNLFPTYSSLDSSNLHTQSFPSCGIPTRPGVNWDMAALAWVSLKVRWWGSLHDGSRRVRSGTQVTSASARGQCASTHRHLFFHCSTNWEKGFLKLPEILLLRFPGLTWSRWTAITEEKSCL